MVIKIGILQWVVSLQFHYTKMNAYSVFAQDDLRKENVLLLNCVARNDITLFDI